jgi:aminoglycoside phosphotransferase family enzyme/predicted kinase
VGDRAYKLNKPIRTAFLDHSTREMRERACHQEVALNRRFAPDVYLGVADVVGEHGEPQDHLVVMRRMPAERQLSRTLDHREARDCLGQVARAVAAAHARQPPERRPGWGDWRQVRELWHAGVTQMAPFANAMFPAAQLITVARRARRYLAGRRPLLQARVDDGWVRDGHGDLLADDIYCLPDGPRILDCLAFDRWLRVADTVADAAFLAMDIESRGHPELADAFLEAYAAESADRFPASLGYHYLAYRAFVRAKIACLAADQGRAAKAAQARRLLSLAEDYLERGRVRLILVGGAPGAGKSTLAKGLAESGGMALLRSDVTRKAMAGLDPSASAEADYGHGLYAPEVTERVYAAMLLRARELLSMGHSVVLDASWSVARHREVARSVAARVAADLHEVCCEVRAGEARRRIERRRRAGVGASDATVAVADRMRAAFDDWPQATRIDTTGSSRESHAAAVSALGVHVPTPAWGAPAEV